MMLTGKTGVNSSVQLATTGSSESRGRPTDTVIYSGTMLRGNNNSVSQGGVDRLCDRGRSVYTSRGWSRRSVDSVSINQ